MKSLVFATNNKNKIYEISNVVGTKFNILSLEDIKCFEDIPETSETLEGNASQKSNYIFQKFHVNCFADDTGLEVEALNGKPGVYSARYASESKDSDQNIEKLISELKEKTNRKAQFRTVISLIIDGTETFFEGFVKGRIIHKKRGTAGFGYDPVFIPDGYDKTFAEMSLEEKNKISHRAVAVQKLIDFLNLE